MTLTEGNYIGDWLKYEQEISRDHGTLGAGNLASGTVLGRLTADDNYVALDPVAATGAEVASAILLHPVDASGGAQPCLVVDFHAAVRDQGLVWPGGITGPQKAAAVKQLADRGVKVREGA